MNILVLSEAYPNEGNKYTMTYVHNRNVGYVQNGHNVDVLSFSSDENYTFEGVSIYKEINELDKYDIIVSHAPNLRNHLKFLYKKYKKDIPIVFFFHGHEIMDISKYYPKDFWYVKTSFVKQIIQKIYDPIKLKILKHYIFKLIRLDKVSLIFVSDWMKYMAFDSLNLNKDEERLINNKSFIVNNSVNDIFLEKSYIEKDNYEADFVTIRPFDNPKYGVDIVYNIAKNNPNYTFHIYGKGEYFNQVEKLENIKIFEHFIAQKDIPNYLDKYKCALMPTRLDAQGVMMCEIATYGMPIITSDIDICREMLKNFTNVSFVSNDTEKKIDISKHIPKMSIEKNTKFDSQKLVIEELSIFEKFVNS